MRHIIEKHRAIWPQRTFLIQSFIGLLFLFASLYINYFANLYSSITASNTVTDLILDRLPIVDMSFVFVYGAFAFVLILILSLVYEPKHIPFVLKSIALFLVVRSFFMVLTHIAPPISAADGYGFDELKVVSSGDDLFFSAHTGLPFMLALMYWKERGWRNFFLISTLVGAGSVLLGHLHYSIDVFSAFFIAFGIYTMAKHFFKKDYQLFSVS